MAGKRTNRRGASRSAQGSGAGSASVLRWYGAGVASGLFVAFLVYLATLPAEPGENPAATTEQVAGSAQTLPIPDFNFYTVLSQPQPELDAADLTVPESTARRALYMLQAGSFRNRDDADRQRAKLLMLGLEPVIEESTGQNGHWFRVLLGPFESRSDMMHARSITAQTGIDTLQMRRQAPSGG